MNPVGEGARGVGFLDRSTRFSFPQAGLEWRSATIEDLRGGASADLDLVNPNVRIDRAEKVQAGSAFFSLVDVGER